MIFLGGFVAKFGLTPQQFADNLEAGFAKHEVDQYPFKPITTAEDYINRLQNLKWYFSLVIAFFDFPSTNSQIFVEIFPRLRQC